jgi:hypothetical protein
MIVLDPHTETSVVNDSMNAGIIPQSDKTAGLSA